MHPPRGRLTEKRSYSGTAKTVSLPDFIDGQKRKYDFVWDYYRKHQGKNFSFVIKTSFKSKNYVKDQQENLKFEKKTVRKQIRLPKLQNEQ